MNAGVYQGESRAIPRWTVTALLIFTCLRLTAMLLFDAPGPRTHGEAPAPVRWPYEFRPLAAMLATLGIFALVQFGRRRHPLAWGAVAMAALIYLTESQAALTGSYERDLFVCGALFAGWLFGVGFARGLDRQFARPNEPDRQDELGEAGARGAFVAIYVGACTSKLLEGGTRWADGRNLLSHVLSQHTFTGGALDGYLAFVLRHAWLASVFAVATLLIQAGMVLTLVGPRLQMLWAALILGFHLNAFLLMGVKYFTPMIAVVALSYPWPRILRRVRGAASAPRALASPPSDAEIAAVSVVARHATKWVGMVGATAVILWLAFHVNDTATLFVETPR